MEIIKTKFRDVFILKPKVFEDERGYYLESYKQSTFDALIDQQVNFIQDNESESFYGVLRGLHFQEPPYNQAKLIRVVTGSIIDVVVDIRTDSETFGEMFIYKLDEYDKEQLFIPRGYAHGFVAVDEDRETIIQYKVDNKYAPTFESGILFGSTKINFMEEIGHEDFIISPKDQILKPFGDVVFFKSHEYNLTG